MKTITLTNRTWNIDESKELNEGGFGKIFSVKSIDGDRKYCAKRVSVSESNREFEVVSKLQESQDEGIIPIADIGIVQEGEATSTKETLLYIIMEMADHTLHEEFYGGPKAGKSPTPIEILGILLGLVKTLLAVGIIHRDIKPQNILLHNGKWKLADFGISRVAENETSEHTMKGAMTHAYAAPEVDNAEFPNSEALDLYSIGCVGYFLITGHPPFVSGSTEETRRMHREHSPRFPNGTDPILVSTVIRLMSKAPGNRGSLAENCIAIRDSISLLGFPQEYQNNAKNLVRTANTLILRSCFSELHFPLSAQEERRRLFDIKAAKWNNELLPVLSGVLNDLKTIISTPLATLQSSCFSFNGCTFGFKFLSAFEMEIDGTNDDEPVSGCQIYVSNQNFRNTCTLWCFFDKASGGGVWSEYGYRMRGNRTNQEPLRAICRWRDSVAIINEVNQMQLAEGPHKIDTSNPLEFEQRWNQHYLDILKRQYSDLLKLESQ